MAAKAAILDFVETRMTSMAPNVCALIGSRITAQLLAKTGGLTAMSKTPSCNLQVRGRDTRKHLAVVCVFFDRVVGASCLFLCLGFGWHPPR